MINLNGIDQKTRSVKYLFYKFSLCIASVIIIEIFKNVFHLKEPDEHAVENQFFNNPFLFILGALILSPIVEEIAFRLPLKKSRYYLISLFFLAIFMVTSKLILTKLISISFMFFLLLFQIVKLKIELIKRLLIVLSVLSFTLIHIDNYRIDELQKLTMIENIFLFLPQLIIGLIFTKVRLERNFAISLQLHSLYNLAIVIMALIINK